MPHNKGGRLLLKMNGFFAVFNSGERKRKIWARKPSINIFSRERFRYKIQGKLVNRRKGGKKEEVWHS